MKNTAKSNEMFPELNPNQCLEKACLLLRSGQKDLFLHCKYLAAAHQKIKIYGKHGDLKKWYKKMGISRREGERRVKVGWNLRHLKCDHVAAIPLSNLKRIAPFPEAIAKVIVGSPKLLKCAELDYLSCNLERAPYDKMATDKIARTIEKTLETRNSEVEVAKKTKEDRKKQKQKNPSQWICRQFERRAIDELFRLKKLALSLDELGKYAYENELSLTRYLEQNSSFNKAAFVKKIKQRVSKITRILQSGGYDGSTDYVEATSRTGISTSYMHS